ncbi:hypothetical protein F4808DRAFT_432770 [Astrocystis sublimbata]|nr:hypothetical protein F4808DRAFT_432770 [Astrocystis sublimbata]
MSDARSFDDVEQSWSSVHQWQADTGVNSSETQVAQLSLAAQCYNLIVQLYRPVLRLTSSDTNSDVNQRRLKRALETLLLWGEQYHVGTGELDKLLDRSWRLKRSVLRALGSIGRTLTDRLTPRVPSPERRKLRITASSLREAGEQIQFLTSRNKEPREDDQLSDDDSDQSSMFELDTLSEIAEDLVHNAEHLLDLDGLYDAANESTDLCEKEPAAEVDSIAKVYSDIIGMWFPKADNELIDYLGWVTYDRFIKRSLLRQANECAAMEKSVFHDSGMGTSVHTGDYAETVMSFHHNIGNVVRIPPLPEEGKKGLPFSCLACGKQVRIRSNRSWKRHLFLDLQPYNCLEPKCRDNLNHLSTRKEWVEHLRVFHGYGDQWESIRCNLCLEETGEGEAKVTIHIGKHLHDIALAAIPNGMEEKEIKCPKPGCDWKPVGKSENLEVYLRKHIKMRHENDGALLH